MTKKEIQDILNMLREDGWDPKLCDTKVPFYDAVVPCGKPEDIEENYPDFILLPKDMLSMHPEITLTVHGDSMRDVDLLPGDVVKVVCEVQPHDGQIVMAYVDGGSTIKTYCEDRNGQPWLLPQNSKFKAISLMDKEDAWIIGCVTEIIRKAPRTSFRDCQKIIDAAIAESAEAKEIPQQLISQMIREAAKQIKIARMWFPVYRGMVDTLVEELGDYDGFCDRIREEVPDHQHLPSSVEMSRLAVGSFTKAVKLWIELNAPVKGKRFKAYKALGEWVIRVLKGEEHLQ